MATFPHTQEGFDRLYSGLSRFVKAHPYTEVWVYPKGDMLIMSVREPENGDMEPGTEAYAHRGDADVYVRVKKGPYE